MALTHNYSPCLKCMGVATQPWHPSPYVRTKQHQQAYINARNSQLRSWLAGVARAAFVFIQIFSWVPFLTSCHRLELSSLYVMASKAGFAAVAELLQRLVLPGRTVKPPYLRNCHDQKRHYTSFEGGQILHHACKGRSDNFGSFTTCAKVTARQ